MYIPSESWNLAQLQLQLLELQPLKPSQVALCRAGCALVGLAEGSVAPVVESVGAALPVSSDYQGCYVLMSAGRAGHDEVQVLRTCKAEPGFSKASANSGIYSKTPECSKLGSG